MPTSISASTTIGELVAQRPSLSRLFEKLGIDYCCGGKRSLEQACRSKGLDTSTVAALLDNLDDGANRAAMDVSAMSLTELANHIETTHHAYLKQELPRLQPLIERIAARHGSSNPKLAQLPPIYSAFRQEMQTHMVKEEQILFPLIRQVETGSGAGSFASGIENPIRMMEMEHQNAGDALATMRQLTEDFSIPAEACNTYRAVMHALNELESDLHQHVHKENNVLFPQAIAASH